MLGGAAALCPGGATSPPRPATGGGQLQPPAAASPGRASVRSLPVGRDVRVIGSDESPCPGPLHWAMPTHEPLPAGSCCPAPPGRCAACVPPWPACRRPVGRGRMHALCLAPQRWAANLWGSPLCAGSPSGITPPHSSFHFAATAGSATLCQLLHLRPALGAGLSQAAYPVVWVAQLCVQLLRLCGAPCCCPAGGLAGG